MPPRRSDESAAAGTKKHRGYFFDFAVAVAADGAGDASARESSIRDALTSSDARYVIVVRRPIHDFSKTDGGRPSKRTVPDFMSYRGFIYYDSQRYPTQLLKILPGPCATTDDLESSTRTLDIEEEGGGRSIIRSAPKGRVVMTYSPNSRRDTVWLEHNPDNVPRGFRLVVDDEDHSGDECRDDDEDEEDEEAEAGGDAYVALDATSTSAPVVRLFGCEDIAFLKQDDDLLCDLLRRQYGGPRRYAELVFCDGRRSYNQTVRYRAGDEDHLYVRGHDGCWVRWNRDMVTETIVTNAWTLIVSKYDELSSCPDRLKAFRNGLSLPSLTFERIRDFVRDFRAWMKDGQLPFMFSTVQEDVWRVIRRHWSHDDDPDDGHPPSESDRMWIRDVIVTADQILDMHLHGSSTSPRPIPDASG